MQREHVDVGLAFKDRVFSAAELGLVGELVDSASGMIVARPLGPLASSSTSSLIGRNSTKWIVLVDGAGTPPAQRFLERRRHSAHHSRPLE
jgi:hypothetical protein